VYEIDGRPAAQVYDEWTGGAIHDLLDGGNILARTSLFPLGRVVGRYGGVPYYRLAHPDSVLENRALSLFADVSEGDQLVLMQGNPAGLIARAGSVARAALDQRDPLAPEVPVGALVVYCAGCMLTVRDRMDEVVDGLRLELGALPFLGSFTFGEQGCFVGGENRHGNLMILVVVFDAVRSGDADA
jgi:hypothetical protein